MLARFRRRPLVEQVLAISATASGALLLGAHLFEWVGGYLPCPLCLDQRQAHWAALGVSLAGLGASVLFRARLVAAAAIGAASLVFLVSTGLALYHTGVENKYWPGPPTCAGGGADILTPDDLAEALTSTAPTPSCTDAAWRLAGVSMAGYNMLASAGLFALTFGAALAALRDARIARRPAAPPTAGPINPSR